MKKILCGLLTIIITILLMGYGLSLSFKEIIMDTATQAVSADFTESIVDVIDDTTNESIPEEVKEQIKTTIDDNKEVKKIINDSLDIVLEMLTNNSSDFQIDVTDDLNSIVSSGIEILDDNGEKEELYSIVEKEEVNNIINDAAQEIRANLDDDTKLIFEAYNFFTGSTFKIIIISLIVVLLLFVALLKKSVYSWLFNLGIASTLAGLVIGVLLPIFLSSIIDEIVKEGGITLKINSLNTIGYVLIGIGVIAIIINIILKTLKNKNKPVIDNKEEAAN